MKRSTAARGDFGDGVSGDAMRQIVGVEGRLGSNLVFFAAAGLLGTHVLEPIGETFGRAAKGCPAQAVEECLNLTLSRRGVGLVFSAAGARSAARCFRGALHGWREI